MSENVALDGKDQLTELITQVFINIFCTLVFLIFCSKNEIKGRNSPFNTPLDDFSLFSHPDKKE